MNYHFFHAPVVAYICMDKTLTPWSIYDLGLFSQSLMLAARNFGIDSAVAVTLAAHPDLIRKELNIPDGLSIIIGIALGYADAGHPQNQYRTLRRSVQEAVTFTGI
jgi:nitroreductase